MKVIGDFSTFRVGGRPRAWKREITLEGGALTGGGAAFDATTGDGAAQLTAAAAAAIVGGYGYSCAITNTNDRAAQITLSTVRRFDLDFLFDPNSLTMANGDAFDLVRAGGTGGTKYYLQIAFSGGKYNLRYLIKNDAAANVTSDYVALVDAPQRIYSAWQASTGGNTGSVNLYVNGVFVDADSGVDNDTHSMTYIHIGSFGTDAGTSGTIYFDNIKYR